MPRRRIVVFASGRGSNLQGILDAQDAGLLSSKVELVVSDKKEAAALERARKRGVATATVAPDRSLGATRRVEEHESRLLRVLGDAEPDLVVLAGYMRILGERIVGTYPDRIVNIHPALLPSFPGLNGQRQALDGGVRLAGCTTHFVDAQVDHGPIILQAAVRVLDEDDEPTLSRRILALEHRILPRTINLWEEGRLLVEGRRVRITPGPSWQTKHPLPADAFAGQGY